RRGADGTRAADARTVAGLSDVASATGIGGPGIAGTYGIAGTSGIGGASGARLGRGGRGRQPPPDVAAREAQCIEPERIVARQASRQDLAFPGRGRRLEAFQ